MTLTATQFQWLREEAQAPYGRCYWHPDTPQRAGVRRNREGVFEATYPYCPTCRPDGETEVAE